MMDPCSSPWYCWPSWPLSPTTLHEAASVDAAGGGVAGPAMHDAS
jgi:hypothetical protein